MGPWLGLAVLVACLTSISSIPQHDEIPPDGTSFIVVDTTLTGTPVRWPQQVAQNLTWCIESGPRTRADRGTVFSFEFNNLPRPFAKWKSRLIHAMRAAAAEWEAVCDVHFVYVDVDECDSSSPVWFRIKTVPFLFAGQLGNAPVSNLLREYWDQIEPRSTPWSIRKGSNSTQVESIPAKELEVAIIAVDEKLFSSTYVLRGLLIHELGHVLGFRHENLVENLDANIPEAIRECLVVNPGDNIARYGGSAGTGSAGLLGANPASYDVNSVMLSGTCGNPRDLRKVELSLSDRLGAQALYGDSMSSQPKFLKENGLLQRGHPSANHTFHVTGSTVAELTLKIPISLPENPGRLISKVYRETCNFPICDLVKKNVLPQYDTATRGCILRLIKNRYYRYYMNENCDCAASPLCWCDTTVVRMTMVLKSDGKVVSTREFEYATVICGHGDKIHTIASQELEEDSTEWAHRTIEGQHMRLYLDILAIDVVELQDYSVDFTIELGGDSPPRAVEYDLQWSSVVPARANKDASGQHLDSKGKLTLSNLPTPDVREALVTLSDRGGQVKRLIAAKCGLTFLPLSTLGYTSTTYLDVRDNELASFEGFAHGIPLITIIATNNRIRELPTHPGGLRTLKTLFLQHNIVQSIPLWVLSLPVTFSGNETFENDLSAESVLLDDNLISSLPKVPPDVSSNVHPIESSLRYLSLKNNYLSAVDAESALCHLSGLRRLSLAQNRLTSLSESCFKHLLGLEELNLERNQLDDVPPGLLSLPRLTSLDLSFNKLVHIYHDANANASSSSSRLRKLILHHNNLDKLDDGFLSMYQELEVLDLSHNFILSLPHTLPRSLKTLFLQDNKLVSLPEAVSGLPRLFNLDAHNNQLRLLPTLASVPVQRVDISHNRLTFLPEFGGPSHPLVRLDMSYNDIGTVSDDQLSPLTSLEHLVLVGNHITTLPRGVSALAKLSYLDVSRNNLTLLPLELSKLRHLHSIKAAHNNLRAMFDASLLPAPSKSDLKAIEWHSSHFRQMTTILGSVDFCFWSNETYFPSLYELDVSHNMIVSIHPRSVPTANLISLDVSHNKISSIVVEHFLTRQCRRKPKLRSIDASSNAVTSFPLMDFIFLYPIESLHLNNNPIKTLQIEFYFRRDRADTRKTYKAKELQSGDIPVITLTQKHRSYARYIRHLELWKYQHFRTLHVQGSELATLDDRALRIYGIFFISLCQLSSLNLKSSGRIGIGRDVGALASGTATLLSNHQSREEIIEHFTFASGILQNTFSLSRCSLERVPPVSKFVRLMVLTHTKLTTLDGMEQLRRLEGLDVSYNRLTHLPHWLLELPKLRILAAQSNNIESLPLNVNSQMSVLRTLSISKNPLGSVTGLPNLPNLQKLTTAPTASISQVLCDRESGLALPNVVQMCLGVTPAGQFNCSDLSHFKKLQYYSGSSLPRLPPSITTLKIEGGEGFENSPHSDFSNLASLYVYGTRLDSVPAWLICHSSLFRVFISKTQLASLPPCFPGALHQDLRATFLDNSLTQVPARNMTELLRFRHLSLEGNNIRSFPEWVTNQSSVIVGMSRNPISFKSTPMSKEMRKHYSPEVSPSWWTFIQQLKPPQLFIVSPKDLDLQGSSRSPWILVQRFAWGDFYNSSAIYTPDSQVVLFVKFSDGEHGLSGKIVRYQTMGDTCSIQPSKGTTGSAEDDLGKLQERVGIVSRFGDSRSYELIIKKEDGRRNTTLSVTAFPSGEIRSDRAGLLVHEVNGVNEVPAREALEVYNQGKLTMRCHDLLERLRRACKIRWVLVPFGRCRSQ